MAKKDNKPKAPTTDEALAQLGIPAFDPSMFQSASARRPTIGAPEQFFVERAIEFPAGFEPWRSGDETRPGTWDRNDRARLQAMMQASGLYSEGKPPIPGSWRKEDNDAMRVVLEFANNQGISDLNEAVRLYATEAAASGVSSLNSSARQPLVLNYANPEAVRQVVRKTSMDLLGRRLSDTEEQRLITGFQNQSLASQRAAYGVDATGGSVTQPLDATSYAESQLAGTAEAGDQRFLSAFERLAKTFGDTLTEAPTLTGQGGVS